MAVKRKSLAPLNTSPKKALKVTSISANNTPAKLQKSVGPIKKNINAKQANQNKQTPSKGFNQKQKKGPFKPADSEDDDDEDEEEDADSDTLEMGEDVDSNIEGDDSDIEEEEQSVDGEDESEDGEDDNDMDNTAEDNESDDDTKHVPLVKIVKNTVKNTKQKQTKDTKEPSSQEKVSSVDGFVLFVGHLNFQTTADEVRAHFLQAGPVAGVNLAKFRLKLSRGFAFVQMKDEAGFKKALKLDSTTLGGRQIHVEVSKKSSIDKTNDKPKLKPKKKKAT